MPQRHLMNQWNAIPAWEVKGVGKRCCALAASHTRSPQTARVSWRRKGKPAVYPCFQVVCAHVHVTCVQCSERTQAASAEVWWGCSVLGALLCAFLPSDRISCWTWSPSVWLGRTVRGLYYCEGYRCVLLCLAYFTWHNILEVHLYSAACVRIFSLFMAK